jgi:hypothetical protein
MFLLSLPEILGSHSTSLNISESLTPIILAMSLT